MTNKPLPLLLLAITTLEQKLSNCQKAEDTITPTSRIINYVDNLCYYRIHIRMQSYYIIILYFC